MCHKLLACRLPKVAEEDIDSFVILPSLYVFNQSTNVIYSAYLTYVNLCPFSSCNGFGITFVANMLNVSEAS